MDFKLVALDIDGTLLNNQGELSPENEQAIRKTVEQGVKFVLVTGRRFGTAKRIAEILDLDTPLVTHNGALIRPAFQEKRLSSCFLPAQVAAQVLKSTSRFRAYTVLHRDKPLDGQLVVHPLSRSNALLQRYLDKIPQSSSEVDSLEALLDGNLIQIMYCGELDTILKIEESLAPSGHWNGFKIAKTYYPKRNLGIIDILDKDCSKGQALRFLSDHYQFPPCQIMAIGDNHNDLEMLEFAGRAVVVANCVEELKGRGFEETLSNEESGVARTLQKYFI